MKRACLWGLFAFLIFTVGWAAAETPRWKPLLSFQSQYAGIAGFLNESIGIIPGDHHHGIDMTIDGGKSWSQKVVTRVDLWGIDILGEKTFLCCGNRKVVITEDGGNTWNFLAEIGEYDPYDCKYIRFVDRKIGWIAGVELLAETRDGGVTWDEINLPKEIGQIAAVDRLDLNQGFLLDTSGCIFLTKDAGKTWEKLKLPIKGERPPVHIAPVAALRFTDSLHGTVLMWRKMPHLELMVLETEDGGRTWETGTIPVKFGGLFLARDGRTVTVSSNNGETSVWRR